MPLALSVAGCLGVLQTVSLALPDHTFGAPPHVSRELAVLIASRNALDAAGAPPLLVRYYHNLQEAAEGLPPRPADAGGAIQQAFPTGFREPGKCF